MKGKKPVIDILNEALKLELGAINQYWLHYRLLDDWGFTKLAKKERAESIEEMEHADKLVTRIIFLEGHPNLQQVAPLMIGQNLKEVLESDLKGEYIARDLYMKGRELCRKEEDYVSMALFEELLRRTRTIEALGPLTYTPLGIFNPILLAPKQLPVRLGA